MSIVPNTPCGCSPRIRAMPRNRKGRSSSGGLYLTHLGIQRDSISDWEAHPFNIPFVRQLDLDFTTPLTYFVGENGSGKSTLIEAIADVWRLPVEGGGRNELDDSPASTQPRSALARALARSFRERP